MAWISVKKRCPKLYGDYVVWNGYDFNASTASFSCVSIDPKKCWVKNGNQVDVKYWQELPKPPKNNLHYKK